MVAECFPVERKERLVLAVVDFWNPDRAGNGSAKVVFPADRPDKHKRPLRVERLICEVLVTTAMERVSTALDREVEKAAAHLAELRGVVTCLERELFDLLYRRLADGAGPGDL